MEEIWKDIEGYEGYYQISNLGQVKSLSRESKNRCGKITLKEKLLKSYLNNQKYVNVNLYKYGKRKSFKVHRLVAIHFIPNFENKLEVNHIDGDKSNNCTNNLEWCTAKENTQHAHKNGLVKYSYGKDHFKAKQVYVFNLEGVLINNYESTNEAIKDGYTPASISRACNNIFKNGNKYKGLVWKYSLI